jgi:hypothetical protein
LKKTTVPPVFQKHLKRHIKHPSELLFYAHRASMSQEDILAVLYKKPEDVMVFSNRIRRQIARFVPKDSLRLSLSESYSSYILNSPALRDNYRGSDFMAKRLFNVLRYPLSNAYSQFKVHEIHVPIQSNMILRLIWIADLRRTIAQSGWEKIDDQNHYLELFSLDDSARFRLREVVPENPFRLAADAFKESGYLAALEAIQGFENYVEAKGTFQQKSLYYQALMTYTSFLGDHQRSLHYADKAFGGKHKPIPDSLFAQSQAVEAAGYILQKIQNQKLVLFNEAHNCGQHRAFMRDILRGCFAQGFRYLSLEDLSKADSINERAYPLRGKSGFYNVEPTFGQMLREAISVGFKLVGHDDPSPEREQNQAANISRLLEKDPTAKVLVWAGHSHIHEKPVGNDKPRMAFYLKKQTGIDPLSIELTDMREHSQAQYESPYYRAALQKWAMATPFVVTAADTAFVSPRLVGSVDMQVFFPRTRYDHSYPHWLANADTHYFDLTLDKDYFKDKLLKVFLRAEYTKEIEGAIPVLNIPLSTAILEAKTVRLFLKPNHYVAVIRDGANWEYLYKKFEIK